MTLTARPAAPASAVRRFFRWWSDDLSEMLASRAAATTPWQVMFVRRGSGCDVFMRTRRAIEQVASAETPPEQWRDQLRQHLGKGKIPSSSIVLRLQPSEVVQTRISVPAAAREVMEPILRNQIDRLAPWPADKALFAYEAGAEPDETGALDVQVAVAARSAVETLVTELEAIGLRPGVVDVGADSTMAPRMNLLPRRSEVTEGPGRLIVGAVAVVVALSLVVGTISYLAYRRQLAEMNVLSARLEALGGTRNAPFRGVGASGEARRIAWLASQKIDQPSIAIALEAMSRALPDEAWLNRLEVTQDAVTIAGRASNADRLVGLLEASQHFRDVQFSAPTTRAEGEPLDNFTITARIVTGRGLR